MAEEFAAVGPADEGTRTAVCLKIEAALRRCPISYQRLVELNLDPAAATDELAPHLDFPVRSERVELEAHCHDFIRRYYGKLPGHAHILAEMLPELWRVVLRRPNDPQKLVATLAANDADRRRLQAQVEQMRADGDILDRAILTLLQDVGERIGDRSQYPDQLRRAGERYQELLAEAERPRNLAPEFEAVRREAAELIREGRLDEADARLASLRQQMASWRAEHQAMLQQVTRDEATVLAERAQIARTRLRYRDAAALLAEAADLSAFDPATSWRHCLNHGDVLQDLGHEFGDNAALNDAIATYEKALTLAPRDTRPDDWATTQNNLGNALMALGERESGTATLERAVAAYELALEERIRERVPLDWAGTQNNLGTALLRLGERESGTATLERAVAAYELALEERIRERVPLDWAQTQNNLGNALWRLGERESGTATLERAVAAYQLALEEWTRARVPLDWAGTQNNLGNALMALGGRQSGTATLERAVAAYEVALEEFTHGRSQFAWAQTQQDLGVVRFLIGKRRGDADTLRVALAGVDGALEEYRAGMYLFYIEKAERLRSWIVEALDELKS
jgi:tetratricopeptide (TPR) repeat protein